MNLKPYPKYKDSGIEWLGKVPEGWEVKRLKYVAYIEMGQSPDSDFYNKDGNGVPFLQGNADFKEIYPQPQVWTSEGNKYAKKDDILISVRAPVGEINISDNRYAIGRGLTALRFSEKSCFKYYYYLFIVAKNYFDSISTGTTYTAISTDDVKNISVTVPLLEKQRQIATFLDHKTSKIDELIKKNEWLIELLKEKRQAIISQAVTKGLDPNSKMKDSGIEWIGEIQEEWEVRRLKWVTRLEYGSSLREEAREEGSIPVFGSNGIVGEHSKSITGSPAIIIGRKGSYGKVSYSEIPCFPIDTTYYIDSSLTKENIRWLYYLLSSINLDEVTFDTGVPGLSREFAYSKIVPLPTPKEQTVIASFLDQKTSKIDKTIQKIQFQIATLKEYRQVLISNVVTGKVMVN